MAINEKITISKTGFVSVQLANHSTPEFEPDRNGDFIKYGENNDYPNYLIDLFNRNAEHSAIISGKVNFISGNGIKCKPLEDLKAELKIKNWLQNANRFSSWDDLINKITLDFELFNGFCLELIFDKKGRIQEYFHLPFSKIRISKDGKSGWYCENWSKKNRSEFEPVEYPLYDPEKIHEKSLYYFKVVRPATDNYSDVYPLPDYMGCISDIETDIEVSMNQYYNLKNGLTANAIINIYGNNPTDDEKREIARNLIYTHGSSRRAGTFYLNFTADPQSKGADVTPLELPEAYKRFESLGPRLQQKIFTGHKVTSPIIFGIKTEGQLGGRTELLEAFETFTKSYVEIRRRQVEEVIRYFAALKGLASDNIFLDGVKPIGEELPLPDQEIANVMTVDEKRMYIQDKYGVDLVEDTEKDTRLNLAQKIGVGGVSSLVEIVKDPNIPREQKTGLLQALYGLSIKRVNMILGPIPVSAMPQPTQLISQKDKVLELLLSSCQDDEDDEVLEETYITFEKVKEFEEEIRLKFAEVASVEVSAVRKKILDMVAGNPNILASEIAKAIEVDEEYVKKQLDYFVEKGILDSSSGLLTPTEKGLEKAEDLKPQKTEIYTVYKYVKRDDVSGDDILPTTREFCAELVRKSKAGKSWTREAIEKIPVPDESVGSVWIYRGGFYNDGKETTPYCRHLWKGITKIKRTKS